jgi:sulfoxide reductase heme-binding subunit YedZ
MVETNDTDYSTRSGWFIASAVAGLALAGLVMLLALAILTGLINTAALGSALGITTKTSWYFSRSSGVVAYILLAGSTIWGLLLTTKLIKNTIPAALSLAMHNILSWLAIFLAGLHGLALLLDSYYDYSFTNLLVPFTGPYRPGWVGVGIIGFYLMVLTSGSFYLRKRIGQKTWRRLHYLTFAAFLMVTVHGLMAGTDSGNPGMRVIYWGSVLIVLALTSMRIFGSKNQGTPQRSRPASARVTSRTP